MDLEKLRAQLEKHEGIRFFPYKDTVGNLTIGVGHNLTAKGINKRVIDVLFECDVMDAVASLEARLPWTIGLDDIRFRALVDLVFNMGARFYTFTTTIDHLENGRWDQAANALLLSKYAAQVGQRARTIANMIRTGNDPN